MADTARDVIAEPRTLGRAACVAVSPGLGLRQADQTMHVAKHAGRGRIRALRSAISGGDRPLFVQAMIDLATGRVASLQALVRRISADGGLLLPGEWLPLIEDGVAILPLGGGMMAQALHWGSQWLRAGLCGGISVNVSARELLDPGFCALLRARRGSHPLLPSGALRLEVLESATLRDLEQVKVTLLACCAAGRSFALNDFGTGYSSPSCLRQLLTEVSAPLIVRGVIDLAHASGLRMRAGGWHCQAVAC